MTSPAEDVADGADGDGTDGDGTDGDADSGPVLDPSPPDVTSWMGLPDDLFGEVVAHARRALVALEDVHETVEVKRLRAIPSTKLLRSGGRRRLLAAMAAGGPVWLAVRTRLETDPDLVARLASALAGGDAGSSRPRHGASDGQVQLRARLAAMQDARDEARGQRDEARAARDAARRARDGAAGREQALHDELSGLQGELAAARRDVERLHTRLTGADEERQRAVDRQRRRGQGARADLERDLAAARRDLDAARRQLAAIERRRDARSTRDSESPQVSERPEVQDPDDVSGRVVPGRPSRLPAGTRLDTRDGAATLLATGGRMLVDGYNVTRTQRGHLSLEQQRQWLVMALAGLAASRGIEVTVVFDAHVGGRSSADRRRRGVTVEFSHAGMTADDELVFAVAALPADEPVVVVTDDRELRARLAPHRVDLLHTNALAWLL